jgi:hypothetical protein
LRTGNREVLKRKRKRTEQAWRMRMAANALALNPAIALILDLALTHIPDTKPWP